MSDTTGDDELRRKHGLTVQPEPQKNDLPSAHDLVIEDIPEYYISYTSVAEILYRNVLGSFKQLCQYLEIDPEEIMLARKNFGLEKYGTILQPFNTRDNLRDALDELADALVYFRCKIYEREYGEEKRP